MEEQIPIYTDLEIIPIKNTGVKRYLNSIKRNLPDKWQNIKDFNLEESFKFVEDSICLRTSEYQDLQNKTTFSADIVLARTDSSIFISSLKLSLDGKLEESLDQIGFIVSQLHDLVLKPNKHYSSFSHEFNFGGPADENTYRTDIRDERLIRLYSKTEKATYALSKANSAELKTGTVTFNSPNNISLSLSIMKKAYIKAHDNYRNLKLDNVIGKYSIELEHKSTLFDYFEEIITSLIFAYVSIETMTNAAIPENFKFENVNERGIKEIWNKENIERWMSTSDKICRILPKILKSTDITKETFWNDFKNLEKLRNQIIHQKTIEGGAKLDSEIYESLLHPNVFNKIKSCLSLIEFFYKLDNAHPYFPLGLGIARFRVEEIESMEKHFKLLEE